MWYDKLQNKRMWEIFNEISAIPRESGNEEGIRKFLLDWAGKNSLEAKRDEIGNVFIYAPATKGYEKIKPTALQGHMDMVCVKTKESSHDFNKDAIEIILDGNNVRAKDTSLGADNGIAIAMILAIFTDPEAQHGPLEAIFTISEETGLTGAFNIDPSMVKAKRMINLDSEEEGIIYIGCAGGIDLTSKLKAKWTSNKYAHSYRIEVLGLLGGHSGSEINKQRGNAIKILARILKSLNKYSLSEISGGTKRNVIPSYAQAVINSNNNIEKKVQKLIADIKNELKYSDPGFTVHITEIEPRQEALTDKKRKNLVNALFTAPAGVKAMSTAICGIVETSNNLAIISTTEEEVEVINSIRSNIASAKEEHLEVLKTLYGGFGFNCESGEGYPEWEPNPSSKFLAAVKKAYKEIEKKEPVITAIHAGLECGIINTRIKGMDSLSMGPNLFDVHSVNEHIEADSAERVAYFLKQLLAKLK